MEEHIESVTKKLKAVSAALFKAKYCLDSSTLKVIYYALVYSHLSYGIVVWGTAYETHLKELNCLHKRILKSTLKGVDNNHLVDCMKIERIMNLSEIYDYNASVYGYRIHKKMFNNTQVKLRIICNNADFYGKSNFDVFYQESIKTEFARRSISYGIAKSYNATNDNIRKLPLYSSFKRNLKKIILTR